MTPADGGAAFPACNEANGNGTMGMSLRDWFAGQALAGAMASDAYNGSSWQDIVTSCFNVADAMLAERAK